MTREERCEILIERGYTYNPENGNICNRFGNILNATHSRGYVQILTRINNKQFLLLGHHFAWYCVNGNCDINQIDHINGVRDDNRICNLRNVTNQQNSFNTKAKGYCWHKGTNKWQALIMFNKKHIHLGLYTTEQEARQAYLEAKEKYHVI